MIVTYGDRYHLLREVVAAVLRDGAGHVVIVFNGNFDAVQAPAKDRVSVVSLEKNLGSAAGFGIGMEYARRLGTRLILLLDDDNLPKPGCIAGLLATHSLLGGGNAVCLQAYRPQLTWHQLLLDTGVQTIALPNTFAWFHLANERHLLRRQLGGRRKANETGPFRFPVVKTSVACYGGLLLPAAVLDMVAPPDQSYFCYYDDIDFTDRISRSGIGIYLCGHTVVQDIEPSWHVAADAHHPAFSPLTSERRIYLDIRNAVHFGASRIDNRIIYIMNAMAFMLGMLFLSLIRSPGPRMSLSRLRLAFKAVNSGLRHRLGPGEYPPA